MDENYRVQIDIFQGPMDLLLHLINKNEIDIYDIPINLIADQFIEYIGKMEDFNLDIASDFLVMAASLLEIKSKMLLPKAPKEEEDQIDEDDLDPRLDLVRRILEYKQFKEVAEDLKALEDIQSKVYYKAKEDLSNFVEDNLQLEDLDTSMLVKTINNIIQRRARQAKLLDIREIQRDEYTLEYCIKNIKERLKLSDIIRFSDLLDDVYTKKEIVTYFLSILELISSKFIVVRQEGDFSDLLISPRRSK